MFGLQDGKYKEVDMDKLRGVYENFLHRLYRTTQRPILSVLLQGCKLAFRDAASDSDCAFFAGRMYDCSQYISVKAKSMSSGKKLDPAVFRLCKSHTLNADSQSPDKTEITTSASKSDSRSGRKGAMSRDAASIALSPPRASSSKGDSSSNVVKDADDIWRVFGITKTPKKRMLKEFVDLSSPQMVDSPFVSKACSSSSHDVARPASAGTVSSASRVVAPYFDPMKKAMVRIHGSAGLEVAVMCHGPGGFAVAQFGSEPSFATEVPNVLLLTVVASQVVRKRPAAKVARTAPSRSAASDEPEEDLEGQEEETASTVAYDEAPAAVDPAPVASETASDKKYHRMYYKKNNSFAVRQSFGNKSQIFSICKRGTSKQMLEAIALKALADLRAGQSETTVRHSVEAALGAL